jgi:hypothetical protein
MKAGHPLSRLIALLEPLRRSYSQSSVPHPCDVFLSQGWEATTAGYFFSGIALLALSAHVALAHAQQPAAQQPVPAAVALPAPTPIAIVPTDSTATVTGALQVTDGKALIATTGTIASGAKTTDVILPHRGVLHVCASTTVKLAADSTLPAGSSMPTGETPGLMMAIDHGALETSFATGRNSDILLTPDFRILLGGPGASQVKVRLAPNGDTCVDNPGANAPYVLVTSVFDGGAYRVEPGQRVMFQHGSLQDVVDQEKEPCGCPATPRPNSNDFPLAESAGLSPLTQPAPSPKPSPTAKKLPPEVSTPMVYQAGPLPLGPEREPQSPAATAQTASASAPQNQPHKHRNVFRRIGGFFRRIFGAD